MVERINPEFYWSEAERLLRLAVATKDGTTRLEMAARFRHMAAQIRRRFTANMRWPPMPMRRTTPRRREASVEQLRLSCVFWLDHSSGAGSFIGA